MHDTPILATTAGNYVDHSMPPSIPNDHIGDHSILLKFVSQPSYLALVAGVLGLVFIVYRIVGDPLRKVPGPFLARFTRLWRGRALQKGAFEQVNIDLHRKHGSVVRVAPDTYSISDRLEIKKIYGHGSKFVKSTFYVPFGQPDPAKNNLFNDLDPHSHGQARRQVAALYSMSTMVSYEQFVDRCTDVLVSKFAMFSEKAQALDVPTWMQFYAFDVIGEITVGKSFGMMERGYDNIGILDAIDFSLVYGSFVGFLLPGIHRTFCAVTASLGLRNPLQPLQDFIDDRIGERKVGKTTTDRDDFLSKLLDMRAEGRVDEMAVQNGIGSNIVAGSDTTAVSLSAVVYHLLQNPVCREKLQKEIADFQAEGSISDPVTFAEAQKMPYLQAVIKEALRMHPAVGLPLARIVPHEGAELAGYYFPAGTCVGVNAWVLHHDEEIFGTDADLFQPERWLRSKEEVSLMNENLFSFGAGSRTCIGKNISLLEMNKVLVQIYRRFNIEHVDKTQPKEWATNNRWFVKQKFECKIAPRT